MKRLSLAGSPSNLLLATSNPGSVRRLRLAAVSVIALLALALAPAAWTQTPPVAQLGPPFQAPPPAPPIQHRSLDQGAAKPQGGIHPLSLSLYSIGQPTDEEQQYVEYINRSRANPPTEGVRLANTTDPDVLASYAGFGVDLTLMQAEFNTNIAVPPLAMNAQLTAAARWHSGDMFANQYQDHYQTNTNGVVMDPSDRMLTNGYTPDGWGENIFSYARSVFHGHAGFNVDWGSGPGGMQADLGHRVNIHNGGYREIGVGVVDGINGDVGPQVVTEDFASQNAGGPLLCGVVYYDLNTNGFYDAGEGIGGVTVTVPGSSYYAVTADSGGYTVPVPSNGTYTVTFTASALSTQKVVTVTSLKNVKADLVPVYSPVLTGPDPAYTNTGNVYTTSVVGAATGYQWLQGLLAPYTAVEGAENGLSNVTVVSSAAYPVQSSDQQASGTYSFHLAHTNPPTDQILTLNAVLRPATNSLLTYAKFLDYAFSNEVVRVQVSNNDGLSWQDLWLQPGNDGGTNVDPGFVRITNSLAAFAGELIRLRFVYAYYSGYYYYPRYDVGVFLDDIAVSHAEQLLNQVTNNTAANSFTFNPAAATNYLLLARARINSRTLSLGPSLRLSAVAPPPSIQLLSKPTLAAGQIQIIFNVANYRSGMAFQLWKAPDISGTWTQDSSATLQTLIANSQYRFTTTTSAVSRTAYRIKGIY